MPERALVIVSVSTKELDLFVRPEIRKVADSVSFECKGQRTSVENLTVKRRTLVMVKLLKSVGTLESDLLAVRSQKISLVRMLRIRGTITYHGKAMTSVASSEVSKTAVREESKSSDRS